MSNNKVVYDIIDDQIDQKLKRIMEQRNIYSEQQIRTWLEFVDNSIIPPQTTEFQISLEQSSDIKVNDEIIIFNKHSGFCYGKYQIKNIHTEQKNTKITLRQLAEFQHNLNIKEVLTNEGISEELKEGLVNILSGGEKVDSIK